MLPDITREIVTGIERAKMEHTHEICYFDANRNVVEKGQAVEAVVRELDENGNLIQETWAVIGKEGPMKDAGNSCQVNLKH